MNKRATHKMIKEFGRLCIEIGMVKAGIRELANAYDIYSDGSYIVKPTRQALEIRLDHLVQKQKSFFEN